MSQFRTDTKKLDGASLVTRYEVGMLSDRISPSGTLTDAFGRLRISEGLTLFDSQHRYQDNNKWNTSNTANSNTVYQINQSVIDINVDTVSGHYVYRETKKVFAYQPGKSLLVMNTFAMNTPKTNLRQRVGYFSNQNGVFLENDGTANYFVLRSYVTGSVVETKIAQNDWNVDKFDGTGYSAQVGGPEHTSLNVSKTNILWFDVEWLGVGDIRCGFIVDGQLVTAHIFHNDNKNTTTYMTTACLPCRYEIENTGTTASNSTMKQICTTIISEGGYQLIGKQNAVGSPLSIPKDLPTANTFVPIVSIRLKNDRQDGIVIPNSLEFVGVTNNTRYKYKIVMGATLDGNASWQNVSSTSSVEYDFSATSYTGGEDIKIGYVVVSAGSSASITGFSDGLFKYQLERNSFANTTTVFSLVATGASNGDDALGSISWEEIFQ
jgi:hypothetical protein